MGKYDKNKSTVKFYTVGYAVDIETGEELPKNYDKECYLIVSRELLIEIKEYRNVKYIIKNETKLVRKYREKLFE